MICKHDPLYRQNNEAAGGAGCPMCKAKRTKRVVIASTPKETVIDDDFAATSDMMAREWNNLPEIAY
ncbi:MAG: hypothetical protein IPO08_20265 [Xanthomonadales bacterium]|nr:hypothetical protein [Xanthomonadales bacterium]